MLLPVSGTVIQTSQRNFTESQKGFDFWMCCRSECWLPILSHPQGPTPSPPHPQFGGSLCIAIMSNLEHELICERLREKTTTASKPASPYLLPPVLLNGSNSHSGMESRIWFRGGAGWAQDGWWGYCWCLSIHTRSLEAGLVVAGLQLIFSLQLSTAKPGRTDKTREEMIKCAPHMGILLRCTKLGCLPAEL